MKQLSLLLLLLLSTACTPPVQQVKPYTYYTLDLQRFTNKAGTTAYDYVKIDLPHISSKHLSENIIYTSKPFEQNSYLQSKWKEPLTIMLQKWLVQSIDDMKLFKGVIRAASRAKVALILESDIVRFEHVLYRNEVDITIRVILIDYKLRNIIKQKRFNYKVKVAQASAKSAVESFNQALEQFNVELYKWLNEKNPIT